MKKIFVTLTLTAIILLSSCIKSDNLINLKRDMAKATLVGKVITEEGLPLEGVTVKLSDFQETNTDINGKFMFNYIVFGKHTLIFKKEGYTPYEYNFVFNIKNRKLNHIKVKLHSLNYLLKQGFLALKENRIEDTKKALAQIETIDANSEVYLYFKSAFLYNQEEYQEALPILEKLSHTFIDNIYYRLTLVEVYRKLELYEKEANLCVTIGDHESGEYIDYLKRAAELFGTRLENKDKAVLLLKKYNSLISVKETKKETE